MQLGGPFYPTCFKFLLCTCAVSGWKGYGLEFPPVPKSIPRVSSPFVLCLRLFEFFLYILTVCQFFIFCPRISKITKVNIKD